MTISTHQRGILYLPLRMMLALALCLFTGGVLILAGPGDALRSGVFRQKTGDKADKKRVEEEEDDPKIKPKKKVEEEEAPRKHKVVRVDEEEEKPGRTGSDAVDLNRAKREAKHPAVRELFTMLAVPRDEITLRKFDSVTVEGGLKSGGIIHVAPLPEYITDLKTFKNKLKLKILDEEGKVLKTEELGTNYFSGIRYYERIALQEVSTFLLRPYSKREASDILFLPRFEQLLAADHALSAVIRFHRSARELNIRKGEGWTEIEYELRNNLLNVQLEQLNELGEIKAWNQAFTLTRKLAETYTDKEDHKRIAQPLADLLQKAMKDETYSGERMKEARQRLRLIEERFPGSTEAISAWLACPGDGSFQEGRGVGEAEKEYRGPGGIEEGRGTLAGIARIAGTAYRHG